VSSRCKTAGGELSWNVATKVLTVKGTVYLDGSAVIGNGGTDTTTARVRCTSRGRS